MSPLNKTAPPSNNHQPPRSLDALAAASRYGKRILAIATDDQATLSTQVISDWTTLLPPPQQPLLSLLLAGPKHRSPKEQYVRTKAG